MLEKMKKPFQVVATKITSVYRWKTIVTGISIAWGLCLISMGEINNMIMTPGLSGYENLHDFVWVPGLNLNALSVFEFLWICPILALSVLLITWFFASKK